MNTPLVCLFITIFTAARTVIPIINTTDYNNTRPALFALRAGRDPYSAPNFYMPPWAAIILAPLVNEPMQTWLALQVAFYATAIFDLGGASGLLLLLNPAFITLMAAGNPEGLLVFPGLWLRYRLPHGYTRGLAWVLLASKPQTTFLFLAVDGIAAIRERDWKAIGTAGVIALVSLMRYPGVFQRLNAPFDWSATVISHYGIIGAVLATGGIVGLRLLHGRRALSDGKTIGLLLAPLWSIYMLQYSYTGMAFTMRRAGWWRNILFLFGCIGLAAVFWQRWHVDEQVGTLGMVLLAAVLCPVYDNVQPQQGNTSAI